MSVQLHAQGGLTLRRTQYIGGRVGPRAGLDAVESKPDSSVVQSNHYTNELIQFLSKFKQIQDLDLYSFLPLGLRHEGIEDSRLFLYRCGNLPQSSLTLSASLRESCRLAGRV
jgi:hypothetical protein